jgi:hypothetical protein
MADPITAIVEHEARTSRPMGDKIKEALATVPQRLAPEGGLSLGDKIAAAHRAGSGPSTQTIEKLRDGTDNRRVPTDGRTTPGR